MRLKLRETRDQVINIGGKDHRGNLSLIHFFLVACTRLYTLLCRSIGRSVIASCFWAFFRLTLGILALMQLPIIQDVYGPRSQRASTSRARKFAIKESSAVWSSTSETRSRTHEHLLKPFRSKRPFDRYELEKDAFE